MPINISGTVNDVIKKAAIVAGAEEIQNRKFNSLVQDYENNKDLLKDSKSKQDTLTQDYKKNLADFKTKKEALKASFKEDTKQWTSDDENYIAAEKKYNQQRTGINRQIRAEKANYASKSKELTDDIAQGEYATEHVVKKINAMTRFNHERKQYFNYVKAKYDQGGNK